MDANCIFCKIIRGEAPATIEYEDDSVVAFKSIKPAAETHLLVVPKSHIEGFLDVDGSTVSHMALAVQNIVNEKDLKKAYKLIFNGGEYQAVPHLHWHILSGKLENTDSMEDKT